MVGTTELAARLGLTEAEVRALARAGLPHEEVGGRYLFDLEEARAWLEERDAEDEESEEEEDDEEESDEDDGDDSGDE